MNGPNSNIGSKPQLYDGPTKVKRLFMCLAEACYLAWAKNLIFSKANFGKGKRMIVKDGRLDAKYIITVPDTNFNCKASYSCKILRV
jgi:hypothetical protein